MPYAVTKAAQIQLIKCLAVTQGPKIRINTVLPGFLDTEWVRDTLANSFLFVLSLYSVLFGFVLPRQYGRFMLLVFRLSN
jgi:NAD(P)-dependent dehydrogenase (short-subunit alcohol dehydrogenase family)